MLSGFALYLLDRRWSRIALICLLPLCAAVLYYTEGDRINEAAALTGITALAASPLIERAAARIGSVRSKSDNKLALLEEPDTVSARILGGYGIGSERTKSDNRLALLEEDDIVDNKTKWRLIVAGYIVFILFAVLSVISMIRLNAKINTLYGFTQDLEQRMEEADDTGR